jgi:hypothetical protein
MAIEKDLTTEETQVTNQGPASMRFGTPLPSEKSIQEPIQEPMQEPMQEPTEELSLIGMNTPPKKFDAKPSSLLINAPLNMEELNRSQDDAVKPTWGQLFMATSESSGLHLADTLWRKLESTEEPTEENMRALVSHVTPELVTALDKNGISFNDVKHMLENSTSVNQFNIFLGDKVKLQRNRELISKGDTTKVILASLASDMLAYGALNIAGKGAAVLASTTTKLIAGATKGVPLVSKLTKGVDDVVDVVTSIGNVKQSRIGNMAAQGFVGFAEGVVGAHIVDIINNDRQTTGQIMINAAPDLFLGFGIGSLMPTVKAPYKNSPLINAGDLAEGTGSPQPGSSKVVIDPDTGVESLVAADGSTDIHVSLWTEDNIRELAESGIVNNVMTRGDTVTAEKLGSSLSEVKTKIESDIKNNDEWIDELDGDIQKLKDEVKATKGEVEVGYDGQYKAASKGSKTEATVTKYIDDIADVDAPKAKSTKLDSAKIDSLVGFISKSSKSLSDSLGAKVVPGKKVKEVRELIAKSKDSEKLGKEFDKMSTAQKLVNHKTSVEKTKAVTVERDLQVKEVTASKVKEIEAKTAARDRLKKTKDINVSKLQDNKAKIAEVKGLDPDSFIDLTLDRYMYLDTLSNDKLKTLDFDAEVIGNVREVAIAEGNTRLVDFFNSLNLFEDINIGSLTREEIVANGKANTENVSRGVLNYGKIALTMGNLIGMSKSVMTRGLGDLLFRNNLGNAGKHTSKHAASDYKIKFEQEYDSKTRGIISKHFFALNKREEKLVKGNRLHWTTKRSIVFNREVRDAGYMLDQVDADFTGLTKEAIDAAKDLRTMMGDARKAMILANKSLSAKEKTILLANREKGTMSRSRNDPAYTSNGHHFTEADNALVHEGAIVKAVPWINLKFELNRLKGLKVKTDAGLNAIADLKVRIDDLKEQLKSGFITNKMVDDLMEEAGEGSYSSMIGNVVWKNQYARATKGEVHTKGAVDDDNFFKTLEITGALDHLPAENQAALRAYINNAKNQKRELGSNATNPSYERMTLNESYTRRVKNKKTGEYIEVAMKDYYKSQADQIAMSSINKMSGEYGLAQVGINSVEDFQKWLNAAKDDVRLNVPVKEQATQFKLLDKAEKYFKGEAQYDRSHTAWRFVDVLKNMAAATKLALLPLAIGTEAVNIAAMNLRKSATASMPSILKVREGILNGTLTDSDSFLASLMLDGNISQDPLYSAIQRMDSGQDALRDVVAGDSTITSKALDGAHKWTAIFANLTNRPAMEMDLGVRLLNTQTTALSLINADAKLLRSQMYKDHGVGEELVENLLWLQKSDFVTRNKDGVITQVDFKRLKESHLDLSDDFMITLIRLTDRTVQTVRFSDMPPWTNSALFSFLGQFKSFMAGSVTNQLAYNLMRPTSYAAASFMGQAAMGYLSSSARAYLLYGDDPEKLESALDPKNLWVSTVRSTAWGAAPMWLGSGISAALGIEPGPENTTTGHGSITLGWDAFSNASTTRYLKEMVKGVESVRDLVLGGGITEKQAEGLLELFTPTVYSRYAMKGISENIEFESRDNVLQKANDWIFD